MPRADAAEGLTQLPVPVAYSGMYVPAELVQWQQRRPKRNSGRKWIVRFLSSLPAQSGPGNLTSPVDLGLCH
jgi:hypothetical protein